LNETLTTIEESFDVQLKELCNKLPNNLQNAFDGHFSEITTYVSEKENQSLGKMATYCLGRQIKACLENEGQCSIYCEL